MLLDSNSVDDNGFDISTLVHMESPPVHLIVSGPVDAENKGEFSKALRLWEDLENNLNEWMKDSSVDKEMLAKAEIQAIVADERLLSTAILALDSVLDGTPQIPDNFVLYLNQHFKRQMSLRKKDNGSEDSSTSIGLEDSELAQRVKYGIIRNLMRLWRIDEGMQLMDNIYCIDDPKLFCECGDIVVQHGNYETGGYLYERGKDVAKAIECFILAKDLDRAKEVLRDQPTSDGWRLLAQIKEDAGKLEEAAEFYGRSGDVNDSIRLYLQLKLPEEALLMVQKSPEVSVSSVESVAEFFLRGEPGQKEMALGMLIDLGRIKEAASIAWKYGLEKDLVEKVYKTYVVGKKVAIPEEFHGHLIDAVLSMKARKGSDDLECGCAFALLEKYSEAYPLLLKVIQESKGKAEETERTKKAWAFFKMSACNSKDKALRDLMTRVIEGKVDGTSKDTGHFCEFLVLERRWMEGARVKKALSEEFLRKGDVKGAYSAIVEGMRFLFRRDNEESITEETSRDLVDFLDYFHLLHSFRLMTTHATLKSISTAAFLAHRLKTHLTRFPKAIQSLILSSGAMYAHACGCGSIGKELATKLMKEKDLMTLVLPQHKTAIENIVRKRSVPWEMERSPCPRCRVGVDVWSLKCPNCAMLMSMCIVSGKHVSAGDSTTCRSCRFPINQSELEKFVRMGMEVCPICRDPLVSVPGEVEEEDVDSVTLEEPDDEEVTDLLSNKPSFTSFNYEDVETSRTEERRLPAQRNWEDEETAETLEPSPRPLGGHSYQNLCVSTPPAPLGTNLYLNYTDFELDDDDDDFD